MKVSQLSSPQFNTAISKLLQATLSPSIAFKLKKMATAIDAELKIFEETRQNLVKEFCEKNEDGSPKLREDGMVQLDMSRVQEWQPKFNELMAIDTSVELPKVSLADLEGKVELSGSDLISLGDLVVE